MGTYVTIASVRRTVGITSAQISDDDVESTITEIEVQVPRYFNTVFAPTEKIEILDGDGSNRLLLDQNPLLSVRELKIDGTTEDVANLEIYKDSGYIFLGEDADISKFANKRNKIVIKYIYGTVEHSETSTLKTTTSAASTAGTTVSLSVAAIGTFADEDWVEIFGMDGKREAAQISGSPTGTTIIVDQLVQTHESGSTIVKLEISENFKKLMNIISGIALVARVVGESAKDITGYNLGELRVQKGEPYTQWRETVIQLIRERDEMMKRIGIRPHIM